MNSTDVLVVRVYVTESSHLAKKIVLYLKNEAKLRGVSVFRAVSGYGESGDHTSSLLDLSLNLPLVIEFFDEEHKIQPVLEYLSQTVKPEHIISWAAKTNLL